MRRLTGLIGVGLVVLGLTLVGIVAYAGWSSNVKAVERERQLVENALDQSVSRVLDQQKAIAWWDDAVINAQSRPLNVEWLETNVGVYFYETYGHDEVIIVDAQNRPIYANVGGALSDPAAARRTGSADAGMAKRTKVRNAAILMASSRMLGNGAQRRTAEPGW